MPLPFIKFFFSDWEGDAQLMACSLAAQGLWIRMMRVMHEAEPYGFFVGRSGEPIDIVAFSKRIGEPPRIVRKLIEELEREHVFSRHSDGRIYSRRMIRDRAKSEQMSENGRSGGNPTLKPKDIHLDKQPDKLAGAIPDARDQNSSSLRSAALPGDWPADVPGLRSLALCFIAEFANCRDAVKAERYIGPYAAVLAAMRGRGVSPEQSWQACLDARDACGGRPLFGGAIKSAISFLPARGSKPSQTPSANSRGASMDAKVEEQQRRRRERLEAQA